MRAKRGFETRKQLVAPVLAFAHSTPPSSSGPGRRVLSPKTGVRLPVGVLFASCGALSHAVARLSNGSPFEGGPFCVCDVVQTDSAACCAGFCVTLSKWPASRPSTARLKCSSDELLERHALRVDTKGVSSFLRSSEMPSRCSTRGPRSYDPSQVRVRLCGRCQALSVGRFY